MDDAAPDALLRKEARRSEALNLKVDYFENLSYTGIAGSMLWGTALYFGVWFDINVKTNAVRFPCLPPESAPSPPHPPPPHHNLLLPTAAATTTSTLPQP